MNLRDFTGAALLTVALGITPLGFLVSTDWAVASLVLGLLGGLLLLITHMLSKRALNEPCDLQTFGPGGHDGGVNIFADADD